MSDENGSKPQVTDASPTPSQSGSPRLVRPWRPNRLPGLTRHLECAGTRAPKFLEQAAAFLTATQASDPDVLKGLHDARRLCRELLVSGPPPLPEPLAPGDRKWIHGPSPPSGARRQFERQIEILEALPSPPRDIGIHFELASFKSWNGQWRDMENRAYVVLAAWRHDLATLVPGPIKIPDFYRPGSIWVTQQPMSDRGEGLEIVHEAPPPPDPEVVLVDLVPAAPPSGSAWGNRLPELDGASALVDAPWLGLALTFGPHADIGEFGFNGPVKGLIDATWPLLGGSSGQPADHRLTDLRITIDPSLDREVRLRFWYSS
jgi:hypothetical protein